MSKRYIWVRIRREDYEKMVNTKRIPIEKDLTRLTGKTIKIKNTQLMKIAANSVWDLGADFQHKIIGAVRIKKGGVKI